tara:strand:- start:3276 stop:4163 length:888 start_codon:yes stop_codon:yes gene_type:complete
VVDRFRDDWYSQNQDISTEDLKKADIIWIISPWLWKKIPKRHLKNKKVICSIYHIDFEKFDEKEKKEFLERDKYVEFYHVISLKTKEQLAKLTKKEIISIPFWVDQSIWKSMENKKDLRKKYGLNESDFLVGSFQRDTEGSDLITPKLIKGPDILLQLVKEMKTTYKNLTVVLTGKRRQYLIKNFEKYEINYKYFEMVDIGQVNELYNTLDLYLVTSRVEGGPQAILECAITKTPILSTDVGVASEILSKESIFNINNFSDAKVNVEYAYQKVQNYKIPEGMKPFRTKLFGSYEN